NSSKSSKVITIFRDSNKKLSKSFKKLQIISNKKTQKYVDDDDEVYNNPNFHSKEQDELEIPDVSSSDEEDIKEGKKRVIGKQGDRSKAEEEESDEGRVDSKYQQKGEVNLEAMEKVEEVDVDTLTSSFIVVE
ncbi:hypothetical protein RhiirA4_481117, partial [Rhizophagus irregularis]